MKIFANSVVALSAVMLLTIPSALAQEVKQGAEMPPTAPPIESLDSALNQLQARSGNANQLLPPAAAAPATASDQQGNTPLQSNQGQASAVPPDGTQVAQGANLPFPMLYVYEFSAKWCPSCRQLEPIVESTASKFSDFIQYSPVDVDSNQALAQQYSVSQIPTVLVIDRQGRMLNRLVGLQQGSQLDQILQHYKQKALAGSGTTQ